MDSGILWAFIQQLNLCLSAFDPTFSICFSATEWWWILCGDYTTLEWQIPTMSQYRRIQPASQVVIVVGTFTFFIRNDDVVVVAGL